MPAYALTIIGITTLLLFIRLLSRFQGSSGKLGLDDLFISIAWMLATAAVGIIILCTDRYGFDRHIWDISPAYYEQAVRSAWLVGFLFLISTSFTKVSVLLFYRRLVKNTFSRPLILAIWVAIGFVVVYSIVFLTFLLTSCYPLVATWKKLDPNYKHPYHCQSPDLSVTTVRISGALMVFTDFYSVTLPAVLVFRLRMGWRQRFALIIIFGIGYVVVGAGIVRTVYFAKMQDNSYIDKTWIGFNVYVSGIAEGNIGIVCACAPSLRRWARSLLKDDTAASSGDPERKSATTLSPTTDTRRSSLNLNGRSAFILASSNESIDVEEHFKKNPDSYPIVSEPLPRAMQARRDEWRARERVYSHEWNG